MGTQAVKFLTPVFLLVFALSGPIHAGALTSNLMERFQVSVNTMVQNVHATQDPAVKREIIGNYLNRMDAAMGKTRGLLSAKDKPAFDAMRAGVQAQYAELSGTGGNPKVADANLNHFADYIQQNQEQAARVFVYGGGGYYFWYGGGAIILLIILFILLAESPGGYYR